MIIHKNLFILIIIFFFIHCGSSVSKTTTPKNKENSNEIRKRANNSFDELEALTSEKKIVNSIAKEEISTQLKVSHKLEKDMSSIECLNNDRPYWAFPNYIYSRPKHDNNIYEQGYIIIDTLFKEDQDKLVLTLKSNAGKQISTQIVSDYKREVQISGSGIDEVIFENTVSILKSSSSIDLSFDEYKIDYYPCPNELKNIKEGDTLWAKIVIDYNKYYTNQTNKNNKYAEKAKENFNKLSETNFNQKYLKYLINSLFYSYLGKSSDFELVNSIVDKIKMFEDFIKYDEEILNYPHYFGDLSPKPIKFIVNTSEINNSTLNLSNFPFMVKSNEYPDKFLNVEANLYGEVIIPFSEIKKTFLKNSKNVSKFQLYINIQTNEMLSEKNILNENILNIIVESYFSEIIKEFTIQEKSFNKRKIKFVTNSESPSIYQSVFDNKIKEYKYFDNLANSLDINDSKLLKYCNGEIKRSDLDEYEIESIDKIDMIFYLKDFSEQVYNKPVNLKRRKKSNIKFQLEVYNNNLKKIASSNYEGRINYKEAINNLLINFINDYYITDINLIVEEDINPKKIDLYLMTELGKKRIPTKKIIVNHDSNGNKIFTIKEQDFRSKLEFHLNSDKYNTVTYLLNPQIFNLNNSNRSSKNRNITLEKQNFHIKSTFIIPSFWSNNGGRISTKYNADITFTKRGILGIPYFWSKDKKKNYVIKNREIIKLKHGPGKYYVKTEIPTFKQVNSVENFNENTQKSPYDFKIRFDKNSPIRAFMQESFIPGWGRLYMDQFKNDDGLITIKGHDYGIFIPTIMYSSFVFSSFYTFGKYIKYKNNYNINMNLYNNGNGLSADNLSLYYNNANENWNNMELFRNYFIFSISSALITNILNSSLLLIRENWDE